MYQSFLGIFLYIFEWTFPKTLFKISEGENENKFIIIENGDENEEI